MMDGGHQLFTSENLMACISVADKWKQHFLRIKNTPFFLDFIEDDHRLIVHGCQTSFIDNQALYELYFSAISYFVHHIMNSVILVIPLNLISWKKTLNDAVTPQHQSQITLKMKANAVPRLLSSLVWIDQYNECNGMTSFMEFMRIE